MEIDSQFPKKVFVNPGRYQARRVEAEEHFEANELEVRRVPGIDARWVKRKNGAQMSSEEYAVGLSLRLVLRQAIREGDDTLLVFSDEVVLRDRFRDRIEEIELPDDWGLFFFGCEHRERPEVLSRNLVRVTQGGSQGAFAIRRPHFRELSQRLKRVGLIEDDIVFTVDDALTELSEAIPAYAAFPNLAWSNPNRCKKFDHAGSQKEFQEAVGGVGSEVEGYRPWVETPLPRSHDCPKVALLFLTVGDVNHPTAWGEYLDGNEEHFEIFHHPKLPEEVSSDWLKGRAIDDIHHTSWGDISLVRATNSLIRTALEESDCDFFVLLSESCVPIKPFPLLRWALRTEPRCWINLSRMNVDKPGFKHKLDRIEAATIDLKPYWHFHSQWVALNREGAKAATDIDFSDVFESVFAADESYYGTVLDFVGYPNERIARRSVTRVEWPEGWSRHPKSFEELSRDQAINLAFSPHFFARKFPPESNIGSFRLHHGFPAGGEG